tara:strand:+ start:915 stop:1304 length:390 start_codon:yes stop_codon:yes gene_type:complete
MNHDDDGAELVEACPWCGGADVKVEYGEPSDSWSLVCQNGVCCAVGPWVGDRGESSICRQLVQEMAVEKWNTRDGISGGGPMQLIHQLDDKALGHMTEMVIAEMQRRVAALHSFVETDCPDTVPSVEQD